MASSNNNYPRGPYEVGKHIVPPPRPSSPSTVEYRLNHLMTRIKDPEKSLKFYCDCLGMHVVFIFNAGPFTIYYLGPRDNGKYTHPLHISYKTLRPSQALPLSVLQKACWNCITFLPTRLRRILLAMTTLIRRESASVTLDSQYQMSLRHWKGSKALVMKSSNHLMRRKKNRWDYPRRL